MTDKAPLHTATGMEYVIFDLASLRYRFAPSNTHVTVLAPTGEVLSSVPLSPHHSENEAAFIATDAALSSARLVRDGTRCRVAFYNPHSAVVCVAPVPDTLVYSDSEPLEIPPTGLRAVVNDDTLYVGPRELGLAMATPASVSRSLLAHQS